MIYVFNEGQLYSSGTTMFVVAIPFHSYIFRTEDQRWFKRNSTLNLRPLKLKHVPKELRMQLLVMGVPT